MKTIFQRGLEKAKSWPGIERAAKALEGWADSSQCKEVQFVACWSLAGWPVKYDQGWKEDGPAILTLSLPEYGEDSFVTGCYEKLDEQTVRSAWGDVLQLLSHRQLEHMRETREANDAADVGNNVGRDHAESGGAAAGATLPKG